MPLLLAFYPTQLVHFESCRVFRVLRVVGFRRYLIHVIGTFHNELYPYLVTLNGLETLTFLKLLPTKTTPK